MIQVSAAPDIAITPWQDVPGLAARWRALEAVSAGGFFRSWDFVSAQAACCAAPRLLAVRVSGEDAALALLQPGRHWLLGETGDAAHDSLFIEHNGMLLRPGAAVVLAPALRALCRGRPVRLAGVDAAHWLAARAAGWAVLEAERAAPQLDLTQPGELLARLSANTRAQIRRALRLYDGAALERAPDSATALAWFEAMGELHTARWALEGKPGAFADAGLRRFHAELISSGTAPQHVDLLRITARTGLVGYLYNYRHGGHVLAYQSGFAPAVTPQHKPGLVCHALAAAWYRDQGERLYDFLAGAQRYKTSLAGGLAQPLFWLTLYPRHDPRGMLRLAMRRARRGMSALQSYRAPHQPH